jgi:coenzyme F420-dependent glucose-6-phosphate dehydrogenase
MTANAVKRPIVGYSLSSEEHGPRDLVRYAARAEDAGFEYAMISDHFHPWIDAQGSSPFVWAVLGGIAQATSTLPVGTSVTCPTIRYHPALIAQAAATVAELLDGRFTLGVGTGEYLNEHIYGDPWPSHRVRCEMLEEAVMVIRRLWEGEWVEHYGTHYTVANAKLYTLPEKPPPLIIAAGGPRSARLAGALGDGLVNYAPDTDVVDRFAETGGSGKPTYVQLNVCWAEDEMDARRTAHRICPNVALPGELGNQLPHPKHYEQAVSLVTEDAVSEAITCGPDSARHVEAIRRCVEAGYDHVHVYQVGPDQEGFFRFYEREVLPEVQSSAG